MKMPFCHLKMTLPYEDVFLSSKDDFCRMKMPFCHPKMTFGGLRGIFFYLKMPVDRMKTPFDHIKVPFAPFSEAVSASDDGGLRCSRTVLASTGKGTPG
jgi:hypothetical protein